MGVVVFSKPSKMSSGIGVDPECTNTFNELKLGHKHRFVIYKITDDKTNFVVDKTGAPDSQWDEFTGSLPKDDCRYAVYDFEYDAEDGSGKRNKILFVLWSPDTSSIKGKMIYASSKDALKKGLVGVQKDVQATDASEIDYAEVLSIVTRV